MLFAGRNKREGGGSQRTLEQYAVTVETILEDLGVPIAEARINVEQGYGWNFSRGSAIIEVYIVEEEGRGYIQVLSPIMHLPEVSLLPLYRKLLEYNLQLTNASLGIYYDVVYVFNERPLLGLDADETNTIITMVAGYADDLDNTLVSEFGGRLYSQS